jgi:hypothetical protein
MTDSTNPAPGGIEPGVETPQRLPARDDLTTAQKIEILRKWEFDLCERMVAEDENMLGAEAMAVTLEEVLIALDALGSAPEIHPVPTTHG